jgi:hypothetical protein
MITIGISNENLSETVARHQFHNLFHPVGIQLVKDIVKQQ